MQFTKEQAIKLAKSDWWIGLNAKDVARIQLYQERLCMPFIEFQKAMETTLGRGVWTHEFARPDLLKKELAGKAKPPTFQEIIDLLPKQKTILLTT